MKRIQTNWRARAVVLVASAAALGCNAQSARVGGVVSLDGEPMKVNSQQRGIVVFRPVEGGATCTGIVDGEGRYTVATGGSNGLVPGDYVVSVRVVELVPTEIEGMPPNAKPLTPAVYSDPLTSGITFMVASGTNQCDISLDSSAGPLVLPTPVIEEPFADEEPRADDGAIADGGAADDDEPGAEDAVASSDDTSSNAEVAAAPQAGSTPAPRDAEPAEEVDVE